MTHDVSGCPSDSTYQCTCCGDLFCTQCYAPSTCDSDDVVAIKTIGSWFCDVPACVEAEARLCGTSVDAETKRHVRRSWHASWSHPGKLVTEAQLGQLLLLGSATAQELAKSALDASQPPWRRLHARDRCAHFLGIEPSPCSTCGRPGCRPMAHSGSEASSVRT